MSSRWIALGAVAKPHGVLGEVRVVRFNPESTLLLGCETIWLHTEGEPRPMRVSAARMHGELILLKLEGIDGRDAAEALRGAQVVLPREDLPELEEDEVYHADLIGLSARLEDGTAAGEVVDVLSYPSADCLLLRSEEGDREVPLLEPYVVELDPEAGVLVVAHLEDLELR